MATENPDIALSEQEIAKGMEKVPNNSPYIANSPISLSSPKPLHNKVNSDGIIEDIRKDIMEDRQPKMMAKSELTPEEVAKIMEFKRTLGIDKPLEHIRGNVAKSMPKPGR